MVFPPPKYTKYLIAILTLGFAIRLILANLGTHYPDLYTYQAWSLGLIKYGLGDFYNHIISDYPPGYLYILWFLGKVFWWFLNHGRLLPVELVYKFPSILADMANGWLIYTLVKQYTDDKKALATSAFFVFNPAVLINSTLWGQVDSFMSFFLLLSFLLLLKEKGALSGLVLGLGQLVKPVAVFILPFYLLYLYKKDHSFRELFIILLSFTLPILLLFIPFAKSQNLLQVIVDRYMVTASFYPQLTANAFNFWAFFSLKPNANLAQVFDSLTFFSLPLHIWGFILFGTCSLVLFFIMLRRKMKSWTVPNLSLLFSLLYLSMFLFLTRMHERHLFYALPFLCLVLPSFNKRKITAVCLVFLIYTFNSYFGLRFGWGNPLFLPSWIIVFVTSTLLCSAGYLYFQFIHNPDKLL